MTRFAATAINLAELSAPPVIQVGDYETILAELKADIVARWPDFNVQALESDPVVKVLEVVAFREIRLRARVNDAARAVMLSSSDGGDLEHLGVYYGVERGSRSGDEEGDAPLREGDELLRERIQLAPEAFSSAGPRGAYIFHARSASPVDVLDADAVKFAPGQVRVFILVRPGADVSETLQRVRNRLNQEECGPLTDDISVLQAEVISFNVSAVLEIGLGPDPSLVRQQAAAAVNDYIAKRHRIGVRVTLSGLTSALSVGGVEKVRLLSPVADVVPAAGGVSTVGAVTITSEVLG